MAEEMRFGGGIYLVHRTYGSDACAFEAREARERYGGPPDDFAEVTIESTKPDPTAADK